MKIQQNSRIKLRTQIHNKLRLYNVFSSKPAHPCIKGKDPILLYYHGYKKIYTMQSQRYSALSSRHTICKLSIYPSLPPYMSWRSHNYQLACPFTISQRYLAYKPVDAGKFAWTIFHKRVIKFKTRCIFVCFTSATYHIP